jgi:hypothetical protein
LWKIFHKLRARADVGEPSARHNNVLRSVRLARQKLGPNYAHNFVDVTYVDKKGENRPMIQFSDAVLLNVVAAVGGKVEHQLLATGA